MSIKDIYKPKDAVKPLEIKSAQSGGLRGFRTDNALSKTNDLTK